MKRKELNELRGKDTKALNKLIAAKKAEITKVKVDINVSKEKNLKKLKNLRHDVAQVMTLVKEKDLIGVEEIDEMDKEKEVKK